MANNPLPSRKLLSEEEVLSCAELKRCSEEWLLSCQIEQHSNATLANRRLILKNFFWFLNHAELPTCGLTELRRFFAYFSTAHTNPEGRWGNPQEKTPVKPSTVATYHRQLKTFFNWIVSEGYLSVSPMDRIKAPIDRPDAIQPFTYEQIDALLGAAKRSRMSLRDEALILFLWDTGARASELCSMRFRDVDLHTRQATIVEGKGGKSRTIYLGNRVTKALFQYLKRDKREPEDALFLSERGDALTRSGLQRILERLEKEAGLTGVRCSPHTFRHTFAVSFLRNGGNQFSLMTMLGHTDLKMTARYVQLAQADIEKQHRSFSPADRQKGGR